MKATHLIADAAAISLLAGCSSTPVVLDAVGPAPPGPTVPLREGYLKVHTATEAHNDGDIIYHPHTSYHIFKPDGKRLKWIENHIGLNGELPMIVKLPAGRYQVLAGADGYGRVTVPVVIQRGRLTEVNLKTWGRRKTPVSDEAAVVRLPNGYVVGWRAELSKEREPK